MGVALLGILALLGLGLAAGTKAPAKKKVVKKKPSKVKIKKKQPKRPPKKKEVKAAKKIKKAKVNPNTKKGKTILKKLTEIVVKDDPNIHPIVKQEAKRKIVASKPGPDLAAIAKLYRAKATMGFPYVYVNQKNNQMIWANKKGADVANTNPVLKFVKFAGNLATATQKQQWSAALKALAPTKPAPSPVAKPKYDLAEIAKFFRAKATAGYPWVYRNNSNQALVWTNKPGSEALVAKGTHTFVQFQGGLATPMQKEQWAAALRALNPDGPAPLPPAAKREIIKTVVKSEDTPPTPKQAARALQLYTKEGGWQGDKSKPSRVVRDCQNNMGLSPGDGIIGQGTRTRARELGYPLYARSYTKPGAYKSAETF